MTHPLLFIKATLSAFKPTSISDCLGVVNLAHMLKKLPLISTQYLAHEAYGVTSGMAEGIDKQAHLGALSLQMTGTQSWYYCGTGQWY